MKRLVAALGTLVLIAVLIPAVGKQPRVAAAPILAGRVHKRFIPSQGKLFVLVIGNDAREGNPDRSRADAIHIVGLDTKTMRGGILNFPRDTWVAIPGHGSGKINEALYSGGPALLARTLENLTGIRLDYWVMTGFEGFVAIVRGLGDVTIRLHRPMFDSASGARLRAGKNTLDGRESLSFVRSRKSLPRGDIDRSTNQARFLRALLRKLRASVRQDPARLLRWISVGRRNTRLNMSPEELFRLGVLATQVKPSRVGTVTIPVSIGSVGSASVVFMAPGARSIFARFRRTARL